jgi:hypothetical protein
MPVSRLALVAMLAIGSATLPACRAAEPVTQRNASTRGHAMRLFDFVEAVARTERFDHETLGKLFAQKFQLVGANDYYDRYRLETLGIDDSFDAKAIDLREPRPGAGGGGALLTMQIAGPCVSLEMLKHRYPSLTLFQVPRGRSADEKEVHELKVDGRAVRFGFRQSNPDCLSDLTFETAA